MDLSDASDDDADDGTEAFAPDDASSPPTSAANPDDAAQSPSADAAELIALLHPAMVSPSCHAVTPVSMVPVLTQSQP